MGVWPRGKVRVGIRAGVGVRLRGEVWAGVSWREVERLGLELGWRLGRGVRV